jgi:magnesium chelatase family protein
MAPADLRKEGSAYDLTLLIGNSCCSQQITAVDIDKYIIWSSRWEFTTYSWSPPIAIKAKEEGFKGFFCQSKM